MIINDSTPDNDNGATALVVAQGDDILLADNELYNLSESSMDYGTDGAGLEIYSIAPIRRLVFTRKLVYNCDNTFEFGSGDASLVESASLHHNLFFKCRLLGQSILQVGTLALVPASIASILITIPLSIVPPCGFLANGNANGN